MSESKKAFPANIWVLYFAVIAIGMGQTVVFAIIPMLGRELQLDKLIIQLPFIGGVELKEFAITSLTSIASFMFFISAPYWGRYSDRIGRKPVIIIGLLGYTVGTFAFNGVAQAGQNGLLLGSSLFVLLLLTRVIIVSLMSASVPASSAFMVDVSLIEHRARGMGRISACNQIGTLIGPALAYFAVVNLLAPLYMQATLTLIGALLVWWLLPDSGLDTNPRKPSIKLRYSDVRYRRFLLIGLMIFTCFGMVQQTLGFYFQDVLNLSAVETAQTFSLAMVASSSAMLFAQLFIVQRCSAHPITFLKAGLPFVAAGYLVLANSASLPFLLSGMGLFGLGMGLSSAGNNVTATLTVKNQEQGALAGLTASIGGMGFVIGPLLGGFIYSIEPVFTYWCASLTIVILIVFVLGLRPPQASHG